MHGGLYDHVDHLFEATVEEKLGNKYRIKWLPVVSPTKDSQ